MNGAEKWKVKSGRAGKRKEGRIAEPIQVIEGRIFVIRDKRVMLDRHLATLYGVPVKRLNEQVKRNLSRFPADFMFRLEKSEADALRSQIATLDRGRGHHTKYPPFAFTELGVAMLSSVLQSERAVQVNIEIMRTFVRLRALLASNTRLSEQLKLLENRVDRQFQIVFEAIGALLETAPDHPRGKIGF